MSRRKHRIEIKIVKPSGTIEYRHAKGDPMPDGTPSDGPTEAAFDLATRTVIALCDLPLPPHIKEMLKP